MVAEGDEPLSVGIGIHTGPALVGCIGSKVKQDNGRDRIRKGFTAIGETVNLAQRIEQLTKSHEGPILVSEQTRSRLRSTLQFHSHGPVNVPGYDESLVVYRVKES